MPHELFESFVALCVYKYLCGAQSLAPDVHVHWPTAYRMACPCFVLDVPFFILNSLLIFKEDISDKWVRPAKVPYAASWRESSHRVVAVCVSPETCCRSAVQCIASHRSHSSTSTPLAFIYFFADDRVHLDLCANDGAQAQRSEFVRCSLIGRAMLADRTMPQSHVGVNACNLGTCYQELDFAS